jgi:hypothetical protein
MQSEDSAALKAAFTHRTVPRGTAEIELGYFDGGIHIACGTVHCRTTHAAEIELSSIRTACRAVPRGTADPLTNGVAFFDSWIISMYLLVAVRPLRL